jgi:hypothetical protein
MKTEKINNARLRNEMEIQSKMLDALLEKAEQVTRLLEVSDYTYTKCEPSHESEAVDQLRADNDDKGNSSKEELRAYLRHAVTKDFHGVGFNCDEAVINKFVEDLILDKESKRMEEENPKIEENYVMPKGNFMSYKFTESHDPPTLPSNIKDSAANQEVLAEKAMPHQQVPRERDPRDADVRACFLEMYQEISNSEIDDLNSKIADGLYSDGWSQNKIDDYIADLLDEYEQTLDPIDPEVRKYYMELLPRLSNAEQDYILNAIIADELYDVGWNEYEVRRYIDDLYGDIWKMTANQSYSKATADIRIDTTLPFHKKSSNLFVANTFRR